MVRLVDSDFVIITQMCVYSSSDVVHYRSDVWWCYVFFLMDALNRSKQLTWLQKVIFQIGYIFNFLFIKEPYIYILHKILNRLTFTHLVDTSKAFILFLLSLRIKPMTLALLTPCLSYTSQH